MTSNEGRQLQLESERYIYYMEFNNQERMYWDDPALDRGTVWALWDFRTRAENSTKRTSITE